MPLSVANYHDLTKVLADTEHHYYVDNKNVKRNSKIYINDATNGATQLKQFYDLTVNNGSSPAVLDSHVENCKNLEFILHTNVNHTGAMVMATISMDWTTLSSVTSVVVSITSV